MRILILGAGGFIGGRTVAALLLRGHSIICAGRQPGYLRQRFPRCEVLEASLTNDTADVWRARMDGVEGVINAAGVLRGELESVHHRGPIELFKACAEVGVAHLVQISALGAGKQPDSHFLATKHAADLHLLKLAEERSMRGWCVVRPSLVIGRGGGSTELFSALAAAPRPIRLGNGSWLLQPIHIKDPACVIASLIESSVVPPLLDAVGPEAMTTDELTRILRGWLGLPPREFVTLPLRHIRVGAWVGDRMPTASLNNETLLMLSRGNTSDVAPVAGVLGRTLSPLEAALSGEPSFRADRWFARMLPVRGILVAAVAAVWIGSGIASFALAPDRAEALLCRITSDPASAMVFTWAGAALDVFLGSVVLVRRWRRRILQAQALGLYVLTCRSLYLI